MSIPDLAHIEIQLQADFCFRLRQASLSVRYQPEATLVELDPDPYGDELQSSRDGVRFRERWSSVLRERPSRTTDLTAIDGVPPAAREASSPVDMGSTR